MKVLAAVLIFILPFLVLFSVGRIFPVNQKEKIIFQPPSYVFGIVWSIVSILLGFVTAQYYLRTQKWIVLVFYFGLLVLWSLWIILNFYEKKIWSLCTILTSLILLMMYVSFFIYERHLNIATVVFSVIALGWLSFACALNGADTHNYLKSKSKSSRASNTLSN